MTPTTPERWLPVVGYGGYYEVSDEGRVRSLDRVVQTSAGPRRYQGRTLRPSYEWDGRPVVHLALVGEVTRHRVQRLVLSAFVGPRPPGALALHNDGEPSNNRVDNLRWGSISDNSLDAVRHGTHNMTRRTHCPRSHPLQAPNLVPSSLRSGRRDCLACNRAQSNAKYARQQGRPFDVELEADAHYARIAS